MDRSFLGSASNAEGDRTRLSDPGVGKECPVSQPGLLLGDGLLAWERHRADQQGLSGLEYPGFTHPGRWLTGRGWDDR